MATCCIPKVNFFNTNNFNEECPSFSKCSRCHIFALLLSMGVKVGSLVVHSGTLLQSLRSLGDSSCEADQLKKKTLPRCVHAYTHLYLFLVSVWICCITGCGHVGWLSFILLCCVKTVNFRIVLSTPVSHQCLPLSCQLLVMNFTVFNLARRRGVPECTISFWVFLTVHRRIWNNNLTCIQGLLPYDFFFFFLPH